MIRSVCLHISDRSTQSETTKDEQVVIVRDKVRAEELARETSTRRAQRALINGHTRRLSLIKATECSTSKYFIWGSVQEIKR